MKGAARFHASLAGTLGDRWHSGGAHRRSWRGHTLSICNQRQWNPSRCDGLASRRWSCLITALAIDSRLEPLADAGNNRLDITATPSGPRAVDIRLLRLRRGGPARPGRSDQQRVPVKAAPSPEMPSAPSAAIRTTGWVASIRVVPKRADRGERPTGGAQPTKCPTTVAAVRRPACGLFAMFRDGHSFAG